MKRTYIPYNLVTESSEYMPVVEADLSSTSVLAVWSSTTISDQDCRQNYPLAIVYLYSIIEDLLEYRL